MRTGGTKGGLSVETSEPFAGQQPIQRIEDQVQLETLPVAEVTDFGEQASRLVN